MYMNITCSFVVAIILVSTICTTVTHGQRQRRYRVNADGSLSEWSSWTACSVTCGTGSQMRNRQCLFPDGQPHGANCADPLTESRSCNSQLCPVDGVWTAWTTWSACSASCGDGRASRSRTCVFQVGRPHGMACGGSATQRKLCTAAALCPVDGAWGSWKNWGSCPVTCGGGVRRRRRECVFPPHRHQGKYCVGTGRDTEPCSINACPAAAWLEWGPLGQCSVTCGGAGFVQRHRNCSTGHNADCTAVGGHYWMIQTCTAPPCGPMWSEWRSSACSVTCGATGTMFKTRTCSTGNTEDCGGEYWEVEHCNRGSCNAITTTPPPPPSTTHGVAAWSEWSDNVACSTTCGAGYVEKTRRCSTGNKKDCTGLWYKIIGCNPRSCTADGVWGSWGAWTACGASCGLATESRSRSCEFESGLERGADCTGGSTDIQQCQAGPCPVDGSWTDWGSWSMCTKSCGVGTRFRARECSYPLHRLHGATCDGVGAETGLCGEDPCPVDGDWTNWSGWSRCSTMCDVGVTFRGRTCYYTLGHPHASPCTGPQVENKACNTKNKCPVDGVLTAWSPWTQCSHSCGGGIQSHSRICRYAPLGAPHGNSCSGNTSEVRDCGSTLCPVDGVWAGWSLWGTCSQSCGTGVAIRNRTCTYRSRQAPHGKPCDGDDHQRKDCNTDLCPVDGTWRSWTAYGHCDVTCGGGGTMIRTRTCRFQPPAPHGHNCTGRDTMTRNCQKNKCPVDGTFDEWTTWSTCTKKCDNGTQHRTRNCVFPDGVVHGDDCMGAIHEKQSCHENPCPTTTTTTTTTTEAPVDGVLSNWSNWTGCTVSCGGGTQHRIRQCLYRAGKPHGHDCGHSLNHTQTCNTELCPVDGNWTAWVAWTRCDVTCGNGTRTRSRHCEFDHQAPHGNNCTGTAGESRACSQGLCPVDGKWSGWEAWSTCTITCGGSMQERVRTCDYQDGIPHGKRCEGETHQNQTCANNTCPVDGVLSNWTSWTDCPVSCGSGIQHRSRECQYPPGVPPGFKIPCPLPLNVTRPCNTERCPVDGHWAGWSTWSACTKSCDGGQQTRDRQCKYDQKAPHGSPCNGSTHESKQCINDKCPVDGHYSDWTKWSPCSATCGNGTETRSHKCLFALDTPHGNNCSGPTSETQACFDRLCAVDGVLSNWTSWSPCPVSCGSGIQHRSRECQYPPGVPHGADCPAFVLNDTRHCNTRLCPVDGVLSNWTSWSPCPVSCGSGIQHRSRECQYPPGVPHGAPCPAFVLNDTRGCNTRLCPVDGHWSAWSNYTQCTVTCGNGTQFRSRNCDFPDGVDRGVNCTGLKVVHKACNLRLCPVDGKLTKWTDWSPCTESCEGGTTSRSRTCEFDSNFPRGKPCNGSLTDQKACHIDLCPVAGHWSNWTITPCTVSCGGGTQNRTRTCIWHNPNPHGSICYGPNNETDTCNTDHCPVDGVWTTWSNWTECSTTCASGYQHRGRVCEFNKDVPKGNNCTGNKSQNMACDLGPCPVDGTISPWTPWTNCSVTCGTGTVFRTRKCVFKDPPIPHGKNCTDTLHESTSCNLTLCAVDGIMTNWTSWTTCDVSCGGGMQNRSRHCHFPDGVPHGADCPFVLTDKQTCNNKHCPVDGKWGAWSVYSACSQTCGNGTATRSRPCTYTPATADRGEDCVGSATGSKPCNIAKCQVDGSLGEWGNWSACTVTCGTGTRERTRECLFPDGVPHGVNCTDPLITSQPCNTQQCKIDGIWSDWGSWSSCTHTCNVGIRSRPRTCEYNGTAPRGHPCAGIDHQEEMCPVPLCLTDGEWAAWMAWSECSVTCGNNGTVQRSRNCAFLSAPHGKNCSGLAVETKTCDAANITIKKCPVDGVWTAWNTWSTCPASCGAGTISRLRTCGFAGTPHGNDCVGSANETNTCTPADSCPADGVWGSWKNWGSCPVTCGGGERRRRRECEFAPHRHQGAYCVGTGGETEPCSTNSCPAPATTAKPTTSISKPTTSTAKPTTSTSKPTTYTVKPITSTTKLTTSTVKSTTSAAKPASTAKPAVDGVLSNWTSWSPCPVSCGSGIQHRSRECQYPPHVPHGADCPAFVLNDTRHCNTRLCPASPLTSTAPLTTRHVTAGHTSGHANTASHTSKAVISSTVRHTLPAVVTTTVSPTPRTCDLCYDEAPCQIQGRPETCPIEKQYCINKIINEAGGNQQVERRCGTYDECVSGWWKTYSSIDKCTRFKAESIYTLSFTCEFCCTTDNCNAKLKPADLFVN